MATAIPTQTEMRLEVRYRGPEVDRGRMSAIDLGPAIFGVGQMVGEASRVLFNDATRVRVEVDADLQHASFGIEFFAVGIPSGLIPAPTLQDLANLAQILGFGGLTVAGTVRGIVGLIRWQRGRKIDRAERQGADQMRLTINDNSSTDNSINITVNEYKIFVNPEVRKGFKTLTAPLDEPGIQDVEIRADNGEPQRITREERSFFRDAPLPAENISIDTVPAILEIVQPSLRGDYMWRFAQGNETFQAVVTDAAFLRRVAAREPFAAGDALRVLMEVTTIRTGEGWRYDRKIISVTHHFPNTPGGAQLTLL